MERTEMLVQSILVLVTATQMTFACQCSHQSQWELIMCPQYNKTVVEGRVKGVELFDAEGFYSEDEHLAVGGKYNMSLVHIYKNGTYPLAVHKGTFVLSFPRTETLCGQVLEQGKVYIIGGNVHQDGVLYGNTCLLILDAMTSRSNSRIMDILLGREELNCG